MPESEAEPTAPLADSPSRRTRVLRRVAIASLVGLFGGVAAAACSNRSDLPRASTVGTGTLRDPAVTSASAAGANSAAPVPTTATTLSVTTPPTTTLPPTTTTAAPTTTTIPLVTEGAVLLVANASAVPGAAGRLTETLRGLGFHVADPTDAAGYEESLDVSKIYAKPEAAAVAESLSRVTGLPVSNMPTPAPIVDATVGLGDASVLLMLGKDLAK